MMRRVGIALGLWATIVVSAALLAAQGPSRKTIVPEVPADKDAGFKSIFDGKTLEGWDANPSIWRVENGTLVGELTASNQVPGSFIIWSGGKLKNFELKMEHRITDAGDSGIYYRAEKHPTIKWAISGGYQDPIEGPNWRVEAEKRPGADEFNAAMERSSPGWTKTKRFTGGNHGGKRQFIALPGQITQLVDGEVPRLIGTLDNSTKIDAILGNGWVESHIIAKNNVLIHITNGHLTAVVLDDDDKNRPMEGLVALHAHPGPPMKVEFRNIRLKMIVP
jgi:3-keto-disaccharide hydrolase